MQLKSTPYAGYIKCSMLTGKIERSKGINQDDNVIKSVPKNSYRR